MGSVRGGGFYPFPLRAPGGLYFLRGGGGDTRAKRVNTLTVEDGLVQSFVNDILKDSYGIMWFATSGGLTRYDSENFISYVTDPQDSSSLQDSYVNNLCEGANGDIWLATQKGLSVFHRANLQFDNYPIQVSSKHGVQFSNTVAPAYDSTRNCIWALKGDYLLRFDITGQTYETIGLPSSSSASPDSLAVHNLFISPERMVWGVARGDLIIYSPGQKRYVSLEETPYSLGQESLGEVTDIALAEDGTVWIAELHRLLRVGKKGTSPHVYPLPQAARKQRIYTLWLDYGQRPYCLVNGKICRLSLKSGVWTRVARIYSQSDSLELLTNYRGYFKDRDAFWMPFPSGALVWRGANSLFRCYSYYPDGRPMFPNQFVSSVYTPNDSLIWVATWPFGLTRLDIQRHQTKFYDCGPSTKDETYRGVTRFRRLRNGRLAGGTTRGLIEYDSLRDQWRPSSLGGKSHAVFERLMQLSIADFIELPGDSLVLATPYDSLYFYNPTTKRLAAFAPLGRAGVLTLAYDKRGFVWGGSWNGLLRINLSNGKISTYSSGAHQPESAGRGGMIVHSIKVGADGILWVGSSRGFYKLDAAMQHLSPVSPYPFFSSNSIYSGEIGLRGNVWVGTARGLAEYDVLDYSYRIYGPADGLTIREFNINASYESQAGVLYFGGVNGLAVHNPKINVAPKVHHNQCIVSRCILSMRDTTIRVPVRHSSTITMPPGAHSLTLFFSQLDYSLRGKAKYQVLIPSISQRWEDVYAGNTLVVTNLPEGRHKLFYRSSNSEGAWIEGFPYTIEVQKDFFGSERYYILRMSFIFLVLFSILALAIFFSMKSKREAKVADEAKSEALTQAKIAQEQRGKLLESIDYAQRIQSVFMPSEVKLAEICPDHFLIFKPKDRLSGDSFYVSRQGDLIFIALVDCTGHGVPGAMLSVVAQYHLRYIIKDLHTFSAAKILNKLNERVYGERASLRSQGAIQEGMDLSICVVDTRNRMIDFSGSKQHMHYFDSRGLQRFKGDNISLGEAPGANYSARKLRYSPNDILYLHTDGFIDQFSQATMKKFGQRQFHELLESVAALPLHTQQEQLEEALAKWQGHFAQVDDISVLGIRCNFPSGVDG